MLRPGAQPSGSKPRSCPWSVATSRRSSAASCPWTCPSTPPTGSPSPSTAIPRWNPACPCRARPTPSGPRWPIRWPADFPPPNSNCRTAGTPPAPSLPSAWNRPVRARPASSSSAANRPARRPSTPRVSTMARLSSPEPRATASPATSPTCSPRAANTPWSSDPGAAWPAFTRAMPVREARHGSTATHAWAANSQWTDIQF